MLQDLQFSTLKSFDNAVAGHEGVLLDDTGGIIAKPCYDSEVLFYESIAQHPDFAKWTPTFFGTLATESKDIDVRFKQAIVLENVTHGFTKPCVLDVKLGSVLTDGGTTEKKRIRLEKVSRETTSWSLGMRLTGMRVWKQKSGIYKVYAGEYGKSLTMDNIQSGLAEFFASGLSTEQQLLVIGRFIEDLSEIQDVLNNQELRMFSASVLIVYEGDPNALQCALDYEQQKPETLELTSSTLEAENISLEDDEIENEDEQTPKKITECKLIDFAHAEWTKGQGPDQNVLKGMQSLVDLLKAIQSKLNEQIV